MRKFNSRAIVIKFKRVSTLSLRKDVFQLMLLP